MSYLPSDNFFTGQKKNIEHWTHHPNFTIIRHDITEPILLEVDQIYHLACPASPPHYQYNPVKTIKTSTMGTLNMLGLAKRVKARILLASTSEIYGDPNIHPQPESYWVRSRIYVYVYVTFLVVLYFILIFMFRSYTSN